VPLGIELAASWVSILTVKGIEQEVEKNLDFLTSKLQDIPARHRSLRAVIDSSWALLDEPQKEILVNLTIFEDEFDPKAAQWVANASLNQLAALMDKSLLYGTPEGRFSLHSLIRQYIGEKRIQNDALDAELKKKYSCYYVEFLTSRTVDLMGSRMLEARQEIRQEFPHVLAAARWIVVKTEKASVSQILISLLAFFAVHGWFEGIDTFRNLSELRMAALREKSNFNPESDPVILSCRVHQAFLKCNLGQIDESDAISCACLKPLQESDLKPELSECLHNLGVNASFRGEPEKAGELLEEAIKIGRDCDHVFWPTYLLWLGHVYFLQGEYEQGLMTLQKCREIFLKNGNLWGAAFAISKMGLAADGLHEHNKALSYHQEALSVFEQTNNQTGKGYSLSRMSMSAFFLGDYHQARRIGQEALQLFKEIDHRWGISSSLSRVGFANLGLGQVDSARKAFIQALWFSQQEKMAPLSLYALAGIACVKLQTGKMEPGINLLDFVMNHTRMPKAFLDQVICLLKRFDETLLDNLPTKLHLVDQDDQLFKIVKEILLSLD
jgi:tetratricopeptide (TPR) repeat protein